MFGLSTYIGATGGAAAALALALLYNTAIDNPHVRSVERASIEAASRAHAMALIEKRNKDNAEITDLDAAHLCVELGGKWVGTENRCD